MNNIEILLNHLSLYGGEIVSTASLTPDDIKQAMASNRMYVNENSLGFVWMPPCEFPTTPEGVELWE